MLIRKPISQKNEQSTTLLRLRQTIRSKLAAMMSSSKLSVFLVVLALGVLFFEESSAAAVQGSDMPFRRLYYNEPSVELSSVDPIVLSTRSYSDSRETASEDLGSRSRFSLSNLFGGLDEDTRRRTRQLQRVGRVLLKRQEAVLKDPRFVNCMGSSSGPEDPNFMAVFAKCYSFAGRPRFGKRNGWVRPGSNFDLSAFEDAY